MLLAIAGCGVKADPIPPTQGDVAAVKAAPTPAPTPVLRKRALPEYDQDNGDESGN